MPSASTAATARRQLFLDLADGGEGGYGRRVAERDFDEVIFSARFRRLAGKAQIFPMLHDDSAHNRLVHSLECASVGRSLGRNAAADLDLPSNVCPGDIAATVATAALTHDIGAKQQEPESPDQCSEQAKSKAAVDLARRGLDTDGAS